MPRLSHFRTLLVGAVIPPRARREALGNLATLLDSGIDPQRALEIAAGQSRHAGRRALRETARRHRRGTDLAVALQRSGLLRRDERPVFEGLVEAGQTAQALRLIAEDLRGIMRTSERVRVGLVPPLAILTVAVLVLPLPRLASGGMAFAGYLGAVVTPLSLVAVAICGGFRYAPEILRRLERHRAGAGRPGTRWRHRLFAALGALLGSGVDAARALHLLATAESGAPARQLSVAAGAVARGRALTTSLRQAALISAEDGPHLDAAEQAGRLPDALQRRRAELADDLARRADMLAEWLPRLVYGVVVAIIVRSLFY